MNRHPPDRVALVLGLIFTTVGVVSLAALMLPAGGLAERFGLKRVFQGGLAVYAAGAALLALATSPEVLIGARIVQGAGAAALAPVSLAIALPEFPSTRRSTAIGAWAVVGSASAVVAPTLGALIVDSWGWRAPFVFTIAIVAATSLIATRVLRTDGVATRSGSVDWLAVPLTIVAIGSVAVALGQGSRWGWTSSMSLGLWAVAAVSVPALVHVSRTRAGALLDVALFGRRTFVVGSLASVFTQLGFFSFFFPIPLFFTSVWAYSVLTAGAMLVVQQSVSGVVGLPVGRLADRIGPGPVVVIGGCLAAAALWLFAVRVDGYPAFVQLALPVAVVSGLGMMMNGSISTAAALAGLPDDALARASAGFYVTRRLASGLGVVAAVSILGDRGDSAPLDRFRLVFVFSGLCYAASAAVMVLWYPKSNTEESST